MQKNESKFTYFRNFSTLKMEYEDGGSMYWKWHVLLHNENDLPDASSIHPMFGDNVFYSLSALKFLLRARHFTKTSTKSSPCRR